MVLDTSLLEFFLFKQLSTGPGGCQYVSNMQFANKSGNWYLILDLWTFSYSNNFQQVLVVANMSATCRMKINQVHVLFVFFHTLLLLANFINVNSTVHLNFFTSCYVGNQNESADDQACGYVMIPDQRKKRLSFRNSKFKKGQASSKYPHASFSKLNNN